MDVYGVSSAPEMFRIDDLLDFSNADIFSSSAVDDSSEHHHHHLPHSAETTTTSSATGNYYFNPHSSADFTNDLCVPSDDAAELEWLSTFVEDSFSDIAANSTMMNLSSASNAAAFQGRCRSKRSRSAATGWTVAMQAPQEAAAAITHEISKHGGANNKKRDGSEDVPRRCTHCASEKTPQWRTGPLGPKTLCNACGVRYKSGRLVPEYRPAASPTFVLTQHSNSHRKVLELRRQKEMIHQQQQQQQQQQQEMYGRHFQVC